MKSTARPAKTQAALLEVMQERQVTIDGETLKLTPPFMTLATQNPVEHEGTYPLPEAQLDRFIMKVLIDYPDREAECEIVTRAAAEIPGGFGDGGFRDLRPAGNRRRPTGDRRRAGGAGSRRLRGGPRPGDARVAGHLARCGHPRRDQSGAASARPSPRSTAGDSSLRMTSSAPRCRCCATACNSLRKSRSAARTWTRCCAPSSKACRLRGDKADVSDLI